MQDFVQLDAGAEVELSRFAQADMVNLFTTGDIRLPALAQAAEVFEDLPDDASVSAPLLASEVHLGVNGDSAVDIGAGAAITRATLVGGSYTSADLPWAPHLWGPGRMA
ncbi:MAG: hypothetical protein ACI8PZ_006716 [Myxococcota bacterium]